MHRVPKVENAANANAVENYGVLIPNYVASNVEMATNNGNSMGIFNAYTEKYKQILFNNFFQITSKSRTGSSMTVMCMVCRDVLNDTAECSNVIKHLRVCIVCILVYQYTAGVIRRMLHGIFDIFGDFFLIF